MQVLSMGRILAGFAMIVAVGTIAVTSTGAFFNDTETSTGNTFTAGAIDLKVDSTSHYNHMICTAGTPTEGNPSGYTWQPEVGFVPGATQYPTAGTPCGGTWAMTDLGPTFKFFNFSDVKPGDMGENTVSLHLDNNPAWACADITNVQNNENTLIQPEINAGDVSSTTGELAQNLNFIIWLDNGAGGGVAGDNIWNGTEPLVTSGTAPTGTQHYTLADGGTGTPLPPGSTSFLGAEWCAGTWSSIAPGATCNGASMGNQAQTDSYAADITFRVEQSRNNAAFRCNPIVQ